MRKGSLFYLFSNLRISTLILWPRISFVDFNDTHALGKRPHLTQCENTGETSPMETTNNLKFTTKMPIIRGSIRAKM